jgi:hypothetical protein
MDCFFTKPRRSASPIGTFTHWRQILIPRAEKPHPESHVRHFSSASTVKPSRGKPMKGV